MSWVKVELGGAPLGDRRLTQRLVKREKSLSHPFAVISEWLADSP